VKERKKNKDYWQTEKIGPKRKLGCERRRREDER